MSDAIITAIITGGLALVGVIISSAFQSRSLLAKLEQRSELSDAQLKAQIDQLKAVTDTKLDELTREVREHNNFAMRMPALEVRVDQLERELHK